MEAVVRWKFRNDNYGLNSTSDHSFPDIPECKSIDEVIVELKKGIISGSIEDDPRRITCYSESYHDEIIKALTELGMEELIFGPDDAGIDEKVAL